MRELLFEGPLDLRGTLGPLSTGAGDPTLRLARDRALLAARTPDGPATLVAEQIGAGRVIAGGWGPGAAWALERARDLLGLDDEPPALPDAPAAVRQLAKRARGVRMPRTHRVVELLVPIALQQLVSGKEARRAFRNLVRAFSERAPGPFAELLLPLGAEQLRALPSWCFPPLGVTPRQGALLRRIGSASRRLEEAAAMSHADAERRLRALPGIGVWSARSALLRGLGAADAVPLGDYNLPRIVAFHLAGEDLADRRDDERMLQLLEPYRGQRGRLLRWIQAVGRMPPRRGPRRPLRPLPAERGELAAALARRS